MLLYCVVNTGEGYAIWEMAPEEMGHRVNSD